MNTATLDQPTRINEAERKAGFAAPTGYPAIRWRKIYVASSWRNPLQADVVKSLHLDGHMVYDFKNPRPVTAAFRGQR